ncbi:MAG: NADH-quinone oxidoreductase subunit L, partial [Candidatus Omnitrophica bacterium]|nr:NADH-quinone oxidoreductase subunit L [Candidatus Omnitrophota bacterium]
VGKSAQVPLHTWLPDAMEGPTPVSALIHAATMVAAGVYLVVRTFVLFEAHPAALQVVGVIGAITAFFAATIAVTQTDIKRVLAYSTISQLGLMMLGLGVGSALAGFFHLVTHACFKALLFLGAGSVIHGTGAQEVGQLGGLWSKQRVTAVTFLVGTLAIAGVPPLAGFWSKDEILAAAWRHGHHLLFLAGAATSLLTALYMGRLLCLTFFGAYRGSRHPHESPAIMTIPLVLLAVASAGVGLLGSPWSGHAFQQFLGGHHPHAPDVMVMALSTLIAGLGLGAAAWRYGLNRPLLPAGLRAALAPWQRLAAQKYYVDELYDRWLIQPLLAATRGAFRVDQRVIDGAVNLAGTATLRLSQVKRWIDTVLVDGVVNGTAATVGGVGALARRLQTGLVQQYLLLATLGAAILLAVRLTHGG